MIRSPSSASATSTSRSFGGGITSASTGSSARASTSDGRPESWFSSPMKLPGPCVTIGSSRPSALCWVIATWPSSTTNMPGLTSPVASS
jgi:hypothetical protein